MAGIEGSYKSPLQGVSQQVPRERLEGQVTAQDNMLSDVVTNLRRRPGAEYQYHLMSSHGATADNILGWYTDIGGQQVHILVNCNSGIVRLLDTEYNDLGTLETDGYLIAANRESIRATTVGQEFFILNTEQVPTKVNGTAGAPLMGYFTVRSAAFSKAYTVTIKNNTKQAEYTYTTPGGTTAGDAAKAAPEYIITQLAAAINNDATNNLTAVASGASCLVTSAAGALSITTNAGALFIATSGANHVRSESDLPPNLPPEADGLIIGTGQSHIPVYYKYIAATVAWLETGIAGSPTELGNMPCSIRKTGAGWEISTAKYEGRYAGDDETNPDPEFVTSGISGMGAYQGRLVLLSGPMVSLSASNKPRRFYRSTVASLVDDDPIHVGASANSSAAYAHCIPFHKDLLLFSSQYQALIPSGNVALTPRTATVVLTSSYDADMTSTPIALGRTVMYPAPRSKDFYGVMEMVPSTYTDSQYVSQDATQHIPKYMGGRCRFSVSSSVANMALFASTLDKRTLVVHEYSWDGDDKVQQAWHKWTFGFDIATAYFAGDAVVLVFVQNGVIVACTIDPRAGFLVANAERRPFLDIHMPAVIVDHVVTVPAWVHTFAPTAGTDLRINLSTGDLAGEPVGFTSDGLNLRTVRSYPSGAVTLGFPYRSAYSPTPPMIKDENGVKVSTNKLTILRYVLSTLNSSEYQVLVRDVSHEDTVAALAVGTLYWTSAELQLGNARVGGDTVGIIPMRTNADTTTVVVFTDGLGELNVVGLEYVCRYNQRIRRR